MSVTRSVLDSLNAINRATDNLTAKFRLPAWGNYRQSASALVTEVGFCLPEDDKDAHLLKTLRKPDVEVADMKDALLLTDEARTDVLRSIDAIELTLMDRLLAAGSTPAEIGALLNPDARKPQITATNRWRSLRGKLPGYRVRNNNPDYQ